MKGLVQWFLKADSVKNSKVVIFSDYGKGSLASVSKMIEIASSLGISSLIDPKGTDFEKYQQVTKELKLRK